MKRFLFASRLKGLVCEMKRSSLLGEDLFFWFGFNLYESADECGFIGFRDFYVCCSAYEISVRWHANETELFGSAVVGSGFFSALVVEENFSRAADFGFVQFDGYLVLEGLKAG